MRIRCIATAILLMACLALQARAACDQETIDTVSEDGDLIILTSGDQYDVDPGDQSTAASWQEGDTVLVCGYTIVDSDQGGEQVDVTEH